MFLLIKLFSQKEIKIKKNRREIPKFHKITNLILILPNYNLLYKKLQLSLNWQI